MDPRYESIYGVWMTDANCRHWRAFGALLFSARHQRALLNRPWSSFASLLQPNTVFEIEFFPSSSQYFGCPYSSPSSGHISSQFLHPSPLNPFFISFSISLPVIKIFSVSPDDQTCVAPVHSSWLPPSMCVLRLIPLPTVSITVPQVNVLQFWSYWRQFLHLWSHRRDLEPHPSRVGDYLLQGTGHLGKDKLRVRQRGQVDSKKMNAGNSSDMPLLIEPSSQNRFPKR